MGELSGAVTSAYGTADMRMTRRIYRIGIVGYGRHGAAQVRYLHARPCWQVAGVVDVSRPVFARFRSEYSGSGIPFFATVEDLVDQATVDAIVVSTTAPTHVKIATAILRTEYPGAILVEKPVATSIREARELLDAVSEHEAETRVAVDYSRRCSAMYAEIQRIVSTGVLGAPRKMKVTKPGCISMNGSHYVDLALFLLRSEVRRVTARLGDVTLDHRGASFSDPHGEVEVEFGNGARLEMRMRNQNQEAGEADSLVLECEHGVVQLAASESAALVTGRAGSSRITEERKDALSWFERTLESLLCPGTLGPPCSVAESIRSLEVIAAAFASDRRKAAISIPLDDELAAAVLTIA